MAESILGLPSSAKFATEGDRFYNHRRKILHYYPNGSSPLTGLLSMMPEEGVNDSIFYWYEKRFASPKTTLRGTAAWTSTAPSTGDADDGTTAGTGAKAITTDFYIKVATTSDFVPGQIVQLDSNGVQFYVLAVTRGVSSEVLLGYIKVRLIRAYTIGATSEFASGVVIRVVGSAYGEGASGVGLASKPFKRPYVIQNTTQIFRDRMEFPGSVLQMGLKYDDSGPYQEKARDTIIDHMTSIERAILFGQRSTTTRASFDSSQENLTVRTMSGIVEFLQLWDAGSSGLAIDGATYAPYSFKGPSTVDTDDQKRVIANADGLVTVDRFNIWAERIGRFSHNRTKEKLCLMGSGAMSAFVKMFRKNSSFQVKYGEKSYGLTLVTLTTPYGDYHLMTHPLFNEDAVMRNWCLMLDIWSLKYRYLNNRDTRLLKNRQNPGDDFRRDEYLTEAGIEFWQPESNMLIKNITDYVD